MFSLSDKSDRLIKQERKHKGLSRLERLLLKIFAVSFDFMVVGNEERFEKCLQLTGKAYSKTYRAEGILFAN
jgi:hypothetical protein